MYRTFHNINNCANVAMYTFLDTLEKVIEDEGKLPDTLYHQIDGGSENTAKAWFALCELIVARRLCKKLVLTRLTVGHTHEDIDSKFGRELETNSFTLLNNTRTRLKSICQQRSTNARW